MKTDLQFLRNIRKNIHVHGQEDKMQSLEDWKDQFSSSP